MTSVKKFPSQSPFFTWNFPILHIFVELTSVSCGRYIKRPLCHQSIGSIEMGRSLLMSCGSFMNVMLLSRLVSLTSLWATIDLIVAYLHQQVAYAGFRIEDTKEQCGQI